MTNELIWNSLNARVCCPSPIPRYNRVLVPFVWCRLSASRLSPVLLFFLHAWFVVIVFFRVLVSLFLISSLKCLRRWWETRPRPRWARSHPPPPVLHWLRDILISGILHTTSHFVILWIRLKPLFDSIAYRLTEPTSGASTPDLDPFSPVDKKRALKGYTFVPDIQEIRVRSEKHNTIPKSVCLMRGGTF